MNEESCATWAGVYDTLSEASHILTKYGIEKKIWEIKMFYNPS